MLTILTGLSGSGKTAAVCREIRNLMPSRSGMVLLTPEQQSHRMERYLASVCGPQLSLHAEVLSFSRMYDRAAVEAGGLADLLPDKGGRLLMMALAQQAAGSRLKRFAPRTRHMDFLPQLLQTAEELRSAGIGPEQLELAAAKTGGGMREKLHDMALLLQSYESVAVAQLGDCRDAAARLRDCIADTSVGSGGVWVDGFTDFTALELQVLDRLLLRGTELTVALTLGDGEEERFSVTESSFRELCRLASLRGTELRIRRMPDPQETPLRYLAENLYRWHAPSAGCPDAPAELYRMDSFAGECRLAAGRIRALLRGDDTLCFRDIAIAVPDFGSRRSALLTVLNEYGIPCYVEETMPLTERGAAVFLLSALKTVTQGWRQQDLFRALKTGFGGFTQEETDILENYCLTWDLQGESVWRRERDWDLNPGGYDRVRERDFTLLRQLNELRQRVSALFAPLRDALREPSPVREQLTALWHFLERSGIADTLRDTAQRRETAGDLTGARACLSLWNGLTGALSQMDTVLGRTVLSGEDFCRMLELLLEQQQLGSIPAAMDAVSVGSPARLRGRKPRILLVLGGDEAHLPEMHASTGLFSRQERESLFDLGIRLSQEKDDALCRPLLDTYLLFSEPTERLILSYTAGEDTRPGMPLERAKVLLDLEYRTEADLQGQQLTESESACLRLSMLGNGPWALAAQAALREKTALLRTLAVLSRGSLSPETVEQLYGTLLTLTASRAETFHRCAQMYFLEYGLRAKERKKALFDAPQSGTFTHYLLEQVFREVRAGEGFRSVSEDTLRALTEKYAAEFAREHFRPGQMEEPRFCYLFNRLMLSAESTVLDVAAELAAGDFEPLDFELSFGGGEGLPAVRAGELLLRGTVDRVDGWQRGDDLYICVGDYKTGRKEFKKSDVWYGIGIQMLLYLHMLELEGELRYGKHIIPAGVLYTPAREVTLTLPRSTTAEEATEAREKGLRRSGILLKDRDVLQAREHGLEPRFSPVKYRDGEPVSAVVTEEELHRLINTALRRLTEMRSALYRGEIAPAPLFASKTQGPCNYCPYPDACGFDPKHECVRMAYSMKDEEFWNKVSEEEAHG